MTDGSAVVAREPCPKCGSRDNLARYDDGHAYCFGMGCGHYEPPNNGEGPARMTTSGPGRADLLQVSKFTGTRGLTTETFQRWRYGWATYKDQPVQVATHYDEAGQATAQKLRFKDKRFTILGDGKSLGLYGKWLWRGAGSRLIITEGELDALTVDQVLGGKWAVVSLPNGAPSAAKALAADLEWVLRYDEVILAFDMDDAGRAAVEAAAAVLPPGRVRVANLPAKDANEALTAGKTAELVSSLWEARPWRPDGVVTLKDVIAKGIEPPTMGLPWFLEELTQATWGRRMGECYALGAGTGIGKTDFITQQIAYDLTELHQPVALFFLEQEPTETVARIAGKATGKRFHVPDGSWTQEEFRDALANLEQRGAPLYLFDHFGSAEWEVIRDRIRFLAHTHGVRLFYLDHLTALAAEAEDERKELEKIMAQLGKLVKELNICVLFVSHLATPEGKPHEEGGRVTIRHFKGSRAVGYWSHFMFGIERDQQSDDPDKRGVSVLRVLKDRKTGQATGLTLPLAYDPATGLLSAMDAEPPATAGFF